MSIETQTLLFNAAPLFAIALAYAAVSAVILPSLWRSRSRATTGDITVVTIFPAIAVIAAIYGIIVVDERTPVQDHLWLAFAAMLVGLAPALLFFGRAVRAGLVSGGARVREAEARTTELDRELTAVTALGRALVHAQTVEEVARTLIDEATNLLGLEFGSLVLVNDDLTEATGVLSRVNGTDETWSDVRIDLRNEPWARRARPRRRPVLRLRRASSPIVNKGLAERAHAKSLAFVPLLADARALAALSVASVEDRRAPDAAGARPPAGTRQRGRARARTAARHRRRSPTRSSESS